MRMTRRAVVVAAIALGLIGVLALGAWAVTNDDRDFGPPWRDGWRERAWDGDRWEGRGWGGHGRGWGGHGPGWGRGGWGPDPERVQQARADLAADLAAELGTSQGEVEQAMRGVVEKRLNEAAAAGHIDEGDVDDMLAAYDEGDLGLMFLMLKGDLADDAPSDTPSDAPASEPR